MTDCERLRAQYPTFVYEGYGWQQDEATTLACSFRFRCEDIVFEPSCRFSFASTPRPVPGEVIDNLVFHLGLAEIPSYWKATCSPEVEVAAGPLSREQCAFWQALLTEGMGEFHYVNQTPFTEPDFVTVVGGEAREHAVYSAPLKGGCVVPVGGGKDSLLTLDLLARRGEATALAINPPPSTDEAVKIAARATGVSVSRRIDPRLLELNRGGYLNGHTPFGAVIGFASAVAAVLLGHQHIVLSNESSANHATVRYRGQTINHQWGKSSAFEAAMHRYLGAYVARDLDYFSLLRPFNELRIAQGFGALKHLHGVFRSCNRGRKTDSWCGRCPKCLSTFIVLAPFVGRPALSELVGKDLLDDPECQALLPSLLSEGDDRPFECVATPDELRLALELSAGGRMSADTVAALIARGPRGLVPASLDPIVDAALQPRIGPLLRHAAVGVVGLGLEGVDTCRYLMARVDPLDLTVIDDDPSAAARVPAGSPTQRIRFTTQGAPGLDIVFKSPGVPRDHPAIDRRRSIVTSNTALYLEQCAGTVIGVTGTKGKSTTTSLIAHVLRAAGKNARLVGNIGSPGLETLDDVEAIHCIELSSFQLEALHVSPHIAVVLGMFPDHLDRHGEMGAYVAAKSSITRYQGRDDLVLFNTDCPHATELAELSVARRVGFDRAWPELLGDESPLLGEHNHYNIWPAIIIGRHFGIDEPTLAEAIQDFTPLPGRLETVVDKDDVRFVCDIRSTAPEVTVAALDAFDEPGVDFLFLGGVDRRQDYRVLLPALERSAVGHVVLFPPTGDRIRAHIRDSPLATRITMFDASSMEEAVRYVYRHAPARPSVCLMSTAAPSRGGLFDGPEDKVRQFVHYARELGRGA